MIITLAQVASLFTVPGLAAAGAVAVSIPIAIHLLSRFRRKRQAWGAMRFVWEAYRRHRRRLQMEQWLLLAVRCLMVAVLGLALSGPVLSGCSEQLQAVGWLDGGSRTVHLVMDDSLTSRAAVAGDAGEGRRFDALREMALSVIDAAGPRDEVVVWRTSVDAGPAAGLTPREVVAAMRPGFGGGGVSDTVSRVASAMESSGDGPGREAVVVLISDWSRSSVDPQRGAAALSPAEVVVSPPMPGVGNSQVMSALPRRQVVVAGYDGGAVVPVEARLRRLNGEETATGALRLELLDAQGRELMSLQREVEFAAGQRVVTVSESLRLPEEVMGRIGGRQAVAVRATLEPAGPDGDALVVDNVRYAAVELRSTLRVGLMESATQRGGALNGGIDQLTPGQWLSMALSPGALGGAGPIEVSPVTAAELDAAEATALEALDVVVVARPDQLSSLSWTNLAAFAESGGLVWVVTPADEGSALWARSLRAAFHLDWQVAIEPAPIGDPVQGVGLVLDDVPAALSMLAADWEALLRPVRVTRWLPVWVPADDAWVRLDVEPAGTAADGDDAGAMGGASSAALMAFHDRGRGGLLLTSAALDVDWTNLPTKPLFVPLVHEALRGVIGGGEPSALTPDAFDNQDQRSVRVTMPGEEEGDAANDAAMTRPGVYREAEGSALVAVNVEADAGDTRALNEAALASWLDGLGRWRFLDPSDPGASLRQVRDARPNLGWPLLWLLLALVLLETVLARTLSHARVEQRAGLTALVMRRLRRFESAGRDDERRAA